MRSLILLLTFALVTISVFSSASAVVGGGACLTAADCLSGTAARDYMNAAIDTRASCVGGVCMNCDGNTGSHCQCRVASGAACNLPSGQLCTLKWDVTSPATPPAVVPGNGACPDCPNNCSGNGVCTPSLTCICNPYYAGADCSQPSVPPAYAINTGVNNAGVVQAIGSADMHWSVVSSSGYSGPAFLVTPVTPPWEANNSQSAWISMPSGSSWSTPFGIDLDYTTVFNMVGYNTASTTLSILFNHDNEITSILLNGVPKPLPSPGPTVYFFDLPYTLSGWVAGVNTLTVRVRNGGTAPNPTGFRAQATISTNSVVCTNNNQCLGYSLGARASNGGIIDGGYCTNSNVCSCTYPYAPYVPTSNIGTHCQCRQDSRCGQQYAVYDWNNGNFIGCANAGDAACQ